VDKRGEKLQRETSNCPEGFGATLNEIQRSKNNVRPQNVKPWRTNCKKLCYVST